MGMVFGFKSLQDGSGESVWLFRRWLGPERVGLLRVGLPAGGVWFGNRASRCPRVRWRRQGTGGTGGGGSGTPSPNVNGTANTGGGGGAVDGGGGSGVVVIKIVG